jgi:hypothetical protein
VVEVVLVERLQAQGEHVLQPEDVHRHRGHGQQLAAGDLLVADLALDGLEDDVDEHVAVPRLQQPFLRLTLGAACR